MSHKRTLIYISLIPSFLKFLYLPVKAKKSSKYPIKDHIKSTYIGNIFDNGFDLINCYHEQRSSHMFLSSGMSVPLFAKKVLFPMNEKSPNQNFLTSRLTTIKMKADFKRKSDRTAIRQLDTTHQRIATRQIRQYLITLLSALYIYWSTLLKLGSRLLQVEYMWRTLFLCIFKLTCPLFRLTRWFIKLSLLAAFLPIWQQANRKFIQHTFYKLLIKRLLCLCCNIQCVRFRLLCSSPCSWPSRR